MLLYHKLRKYDGIVIVSLIPSPVQWTFPLMAEVINSKQPPGHSFVLYWSYKTMKIIPTVAQKIKTHGYDTIPVSLHLIAISCKKNC